LDEIEEDEVHARMMELLEGCGDVCDTSIEGVESKFFPRISKEVDCAGLWGNAAIDKARPAGPAPEMSPAMREHFSYGGRVALLRYDGAPYALLDNPYVNAPAQLPEWSEEMIDAWALQCLEGSLRGGYGEQDTAMVLEGLRRMPSIPGGHVLVIGSERPWLEACVLAAGARHVTTLEYGAVRCTHPQVDTLVPGEMGAMFLNGSLTTFDAVASFSSVEHTGLGRYGDGLNPWGDLQTIARAWCVTRAGGGMLLGVPNRGGDRVEWNAHRNYGPVMYSHLAANWDQDQRLDHGIGQSNQRVHLFRKPGKQVSDFTPPK